MLTLLELVSLILDGLAVKGQPRPQSVFRILPDWGIRTEKSGSQHHLGVRRSTMWPERAHRLLQFTALFRRIWNGY